MDLTVLFQEFAKAGLLPMAMAIVIWALWKEWGKERDKNDGLSQKITEQLYSAKSQNDSTQALLVVMRDEIKAVRTTLESFPKLLRKGK